MLNIRKISPVVRATGIIGVVAGLATAVTFAALQSQATLTNNTISTGTASLQVATVGVEGCNNDWASSQDGFDFSVPTGSGNSQTENFCVRNNGDTNLGTNMSISALPTYTDGVNPVSVNNNLVNFVMSCTVTPSGSISTNDALSTLFVSGTNLGTLNSANVANCNAHVLIDPSAFTAPHIQSSGFDVVFTGTAS